MKNEDIIESIISVLAVDGAINTQEMRFFIEVCKRFDLSKEAINTAFGKVKQGKGRIHVPTDKADKKRLLYFLVQAVVADGTVTSQERKILNSVVEKMGMGEIDVEKFIQLRLQEITSAHSSEENSSAETPPPTSVKRSGKPDSQNARIVCPKCGHKQTTAYQCKRCGIIFEKYKPIQEPGDEDEERLMELLASSNKIKNREA
jgi:uncharacterized tellurite resistance protein B-like protein